MQSTDNFIIYFYEQKDEFLLKYLQVLNLWQSLNFEFLKIWEISIKYSIIIKYMRITSINIFEIFCIKEPVYDILNINL